MAKNLRLRHRAKLFMNGRSQAVRLPVDYRFDCDEVYIRRDLKTGDVIISKKPDSWEVFFEMTKAVDIPEDFMSERDNESVRNRNLFR